MDAGSFNAFTSPNLPPLANAEVDIKSDYSSANIYTVLIVPFLLNENISLPPNIKMCSIILLPFTASLCTSCSFQCSYNEAFNIQKRTKVMP